MNSSDSGFDCAIIGAGPAGMSAAITMARHGVRPLVLDRAPRGGGQIYRNAAGSSLPDAGLLGPDYTVGADLIRDFEGADVRHEAGADVWHVGDDGRILYSLNGETRQASAREILIAPGAIERPMPIPGWTLPGVMTAGAAQVMLKSDAMVADNAVFAGSGPLLLLIVTQYLRLGVPIAGVVDTTPRENYLRAAPLLPAALRAPKLLAKGAALLAGLRRAGIPVYRAATDLRVEGDGRAKALYFTSGGQAQRIAAENIFLHHGVIPNANMARALGLEHIWNEEQLAWQVKRDEWGQSTVPHISVAGDGGAIVGADGARHGGHLAVLNMLTRLGRIDPATRDRLGAPSLAEQKRLAGFRRFIDRLYRPARALRVPENSDTLVCRCEEQTVNDLRAGFDEGARDPNALKSRTRCGMGPCQGRQCGPTVSALLSDWRGEPVADVGYFRLRSPQRLLNLEEFSRFRMAVPDQEAAE